MEKTRITIRKKIILPLIVSLAALFGLFAFAGCSDRIKSLQEYKDRLGCDYIVTYNYNGGKVFDKPTTTVFLKKENNYAPEPGTAVTAKDFPLPVRGGYSLKDYVVAELDDDGNLVFDADGNVKGKVWDFNKDKVTQDVTLYARWWQNYQVVLHYGNDYSSSKSTSIPRDRDGSPEKNADGTDKSIPDSALTPDDATVLEYYERKDSTSEFDPKTVKLTEALFGSSEDLRTYDIWAKTLDGVYRVIRSADDMKFTFDVTTNVYFDADVDMEGASGFSIPSDYSGKFVGNGHTISNLKVTNTVSGISEQYAGLFQSLSDGASITDITFKNSVCTVELDNARATSYSVGKFVGKLSGKVNVSNVKFENYTFNVNIVADYDLFDKVHMGDLYGYKESSSTGVFDVSMPNADVVMSDLVLSSDEKYNVCLKYIDGVDGKKVVDVYNIMVFYAGGWVPVNISKDIEHDGNVWSITEVLGRNTTVYTITVTVSGEKIVADVTETTTTDQ